MQPNQDAYYWLFSSSSQTISTFIAFLLTGFALVLSIMDSQRQKDETLEEIHEKLKFDYYKRLQVLAIVTGAAIILSLSMIYINAIAFQYKQCLFILTMALSVGAIALGIVFVISIINPNKYKAAAKAILKEDHHGVIENDNIIDNVDFMKEFIALEKMIRQILRSKELYIPFGNTPKMAYSFRQMANALFYNEFIDKELLNKLLETNKYRNLIFHGHQDKVEKSMLDSLRSITSAINDIYKKHTNRDNNQS